MSENNIQITKKDLLEAIISGTITINWNKHKTHFDIDYIKERLDDLISLANGDNDVKWSNNEERNIEERNIEERNTRLREYYQKDLDRIYNDGEVIKRDDILKEKCGECGVELHPKLDLNKMELDYAYEVSYKGGGFIITNVGECEMADKTEFTSTVDVTSSLILMNHFGEDIFDDAPKDEKWSQEWSLCTLKGRERITGYLEEQNVLFGQLGNSVAAVFISDDKKSIIIGEEYQYDHETGGEAKIKHEGYTKVGEICCDVWRWMGVDKNTLTEEKLDKFKSEHSHMDVVELDVPAGKWKMNHYYDFYKNPKNKEGIWSEIKLVE